MFFIFSSFRCPVCNYLSANHQQFPTISLPMVEVPGELGMDEYRQTDMRQEIRSEIATEFSNSLTVSRAEATGLRARLKKMTEERNAQVVELGELREKLQDSLKIRKERKNELKLKCLELQQAKQKIQDLQNPRM